LVGSLHVDIQSTGQKSGPVIRLSPSPDPYVLIRQLDSPWSQQFWADLTSPRAGPGRARARPRPGRPPQPQGTHGFKQPSRAALVQGSPRGAGRPPYSLRRSPEPILIPRLRIEFADFPDTTLFYGLKAAHLGALMRLSVRSPISPAARATLQLFKDPAGRPGRGVRRPALPRLAP